MALEDAMLQGEVPGFESTTWQPEYLRHHATEQSEYLDKVAASDVIRQVAERAMELLALSPGAKVLELGCGNGVFLPRLAKAVGVEGRVVGVDHSPDLIAQARAKVIAEGLGDGVDLQVGDAYALPFADGHFDAAHCERVLMHLERPNAVLAELARVVKPGGVIVAAEPDWMGIRIDHPDRELFDVVYARAQKHRNVDMGLTLYRRFAEVGLMNRRYATVSVVIDDYSAWKMFGLDLDPEVESLASEGTIDPSRLAAILPALDSANESGRFYSAVTLHLASGVVPG
jgi:SAM-dependent methyltransferase